MTKFGLAQPVRRVEDPRLLKGGGRYTDDIAARWPAARRGAAQPARGGARSPRSTPRRRRRSRACCAVYTSADLNADGIGGLPCAVALKNRDGSDMPMPPHPVLADGMVRHVGDPVAFVVAETTQAARDAAEAIVVDYDVLPSATDLATAIDAGQPLVWPDAPNNRVFDWAIGDKDKTDALFASAAQVTQSDRGEQPHRGQRDGGARGLHRRVRRRQPGAGRCTPTPRAAGW